MKALVYDAPESFEVKEVPVPSAGPGQVLISVKACGICKTDVHIHRGRFISTFPLTPGHEFAGEVAVLGAGVEGFAPGDRVTADNAVPCGYCYYCRRDQPLYCENFYSLGCNGPGGFAEYVLVGCDKVFRLPEDLSFEQAVFAEPTACVVHCMDVVDLQPADEVLLFGAGPAGLVLAQMIKSCGASRLVVAAPTESKLALARALAADHTVMVERSDLASAREEILGLAPRGYDVVVDATGSASITGQCLPFAKFGGKVVVFGVPDEADTISVSPYDIYRREIKLIGTFAQTHCFDRALASLAGGAVKVDRLVTHTFTLADYAEAISTVMTDREALKVVITPE